MLSCLSSRCSRITLLLYVYCLPPASRMWALKALLFTVSSSRTGPGTWKALKKYGLRSAQCSATLLRFPCLAIALTKNNSKSWKSSSVLLLQPCNYYSLLKWYPKIHSLLNVFFSSLEFIIAFSLCGLAFFFLINFYCSIVAWWCWLYNKVNQLYTYIYALFFGFPSYSGHHRALRVSCVYSRSLLFVLCMCSVVSNSLWPHGW